MVLRRAIAGCGEFKGAPKASGTEHYTNWVPKADQVCVWLAAFVRDHVSIVAVSRASKAKAKAARTRGARTNAKVALLLLPQRKGRQRWQRWNATSAISLVITRRAARRD